MGSYGIYKSWRKGLGGEKDLAEMNYSFVYSINVQHIVF